MLPQRFFPCNLCNGFSPTQLNRSLYNFTSTYISQSVTLDQNCCPCLIHIFLQGTFHLLALKRNKWFLENLSVELRTCTIFKWDNFRLHKLFIQSRRRILVVSRVKCKCGRRNGSNFSKKVSAHHAEELGPLACWIFRLDLWVVVGIDLERTDLKVYNDVFRTEFPKTVAFTFSKASFLRDWSPRLVCMETAYSSTVTSHNLS